MKNYNTTKHIGILGCGWLGLPLGEALTDENYKIKGTTTSEAKMKKLSGSKIEAHQIILKPEGIYGNISNFLENVETLIINIPPGLRKNPEKNHVAELQHLIEAIENSDVKNVLYVSSISVFANATHFPEYHSSSTPNSESSTAKQLIEIENLLQHNSSFNTTILRFGGLIGNDRHPAKYLSGRTNISNPQAPINLIHRIDCIAIISELIKNNFWNVTLNAVFPHHPTKQTYYCSYCKTHQLKLPEFNTSQKSKGKLIDSSKLVQLLNYSFIQRV